MSRHRSFITEGPPWEIYVKFRAWVFEHRTHPQAFSFGVQVMQRQDKAWTLHRFRHHWNTLIIERLVRHERDTNAVIITTSAELEHMEGIDPRVITAVKSLEDAEAEMTSQLAYDDQTLGEQIPVKKADSILW